MLQNTTKRQKGHENVNKYKLIMFIDDFLISCFEMSRHHSRAVRRRHCVGGGAPVNFGRRRRAGQFWPAAPFPKKSAATRGGIAGQKFFFKYSRKNFVVSSKFSDDLFFLFLVIDRKIA